MTSDHPQVAVIGGGPAGLMAAETLARGGVAVTVYDRMPSLARKFLMAGRGGLNLTHSEPFDRFLAAYEGAPAPILDAVRAFTPDELRAWCEGLGEPVFVGSSGRVFPVSLKASPLLRAWLRRLEALGVKVALRYAWAGFEGDDLLFVGPGGERVAARPDAAVLALGGASWPRLGSDGAWTEALRGIGVAVAPLAPANMGVRIAWSDHVRERFAGAPLKRIALALDGRSVRGEAIVTRDGLEGGAVYTLSAPIREAFEAAGTARLTVDLRPDLSEGALAQRLAASRKGESLANKLRKAAGLSPVASAVLREGHGLALPTEPEGLATAVKAVPITVTGLQGLDRAISTAGGIALNEIDRAFMLRRRPGTFVAGEMLDWEAPTGGYLLQASFATGVAAGRGVLGWLERR
ncbi:MAG TPA: TIGR03862 family flavoprotein [Beijerinckiaceae bacterium]|jgi:uncharacterized flavoprotein (TIGR03862 family)